MIIVVVDMWDKHWCKTFSKRLGEFVPRINEGLALARKLGHTVMFMPAAVTSFYAGSPQRQAALALPHYQMPMPVRFNPVVMLPNLETWPTCECSDSVCSKQEVWTRMHPDLVIAEQDFISEVPWELYNLLREREARRLLYVGASANLCILVRPFGVINMLQHGVSAGVASDMVLAWSPQLFDLGLPSVLQHISVYITDVVCFEEAIR